MSLKEMGTDVRPGGRGIDREYIYDLSLIPHI